MMKNRIGQTNWIGMLIIIMILFLIGGFALMKVERRKDMDQQFEQLKKQGYKNKAKRLADEPPGLLQKSTW